MQHRNDAEAAKAECLFEQALKRPKDFLGQSPQVRWGIDKSLGILDWDGSCEHQTDRMCSVCLARYRNRH